MRGKAVVKRHFIVVFRITPAYAGKREIPALGYLT